MAAVFICYLLIIPKKRKKKNQETTSKSCLAVSLLDSWLEEAVFIVVEVALSARDWDDESRFWMGQKEPVPGGEKWTKEKEKEDFNDIFLH